RPPPQARLLGSAVRARDSPCPDDGPGTALPSAAVRAPAPAPSGFVRPAPRRPDPSPLPGPSGSKTRIVLPWTTFQENIRVYVDPKGVARADHDLDLGRAI